MLQSEVQALHAHRNRPRPAETHLSGGRTVVTELRTTPGLSPSVATKCPSVPLRSRPPRVSSPHFLRGIEGRHPR